MPPSGNKRAWYGKAPDKGWANITYIEKDIFDSLYNLIFIEVSPQNTKFYSQNGILYTRDGRLFAHPNRQMKKIRQQYLLFYFFITSYNIMKKVC